MGVYIKNELKGNKLTSALGLKKHVFPSTPPEVPYSKYMRVERNKFVLGEHIMLNSRCKLIHDNGESVTENITIDFAEKKNDGTEKLRPLVKFLHLRSSPKGIVYGFSAQDVLIKTSYLQMIEIIEIDCDAYKVKGDIL
ncbi:hypothetical protein GLOIN_2v1764157 [Rhizophagus clarus]|uniref:Uncharacterized protein n=1 Tax=Rhizophagus clarus TaxID=94130 RepID=A0A8H3L082_9GLOM|nr:hypothetical protein GLOIN_2v1764157 [Rhizophagus clarus]